MAYNDYDEDNALERGLNRAQLEQIQATKGASNTELASISDNKLRSLLRNLEIPDRPHARHQFTRLQQIDETGSVQEDALAKATQQLQELRSNTLQNRVAGLPSGVVQNPQVLALPAAAGINFATQWKAIGPGNIGGRTRSIVIHPTQPDTIWAASVGGGVWRTDDGGQSWSPVDDMMANLAVTSMAMHPTNPDILFASTGEGFFNVDAIRGAGIFRTLDGTNWSHLASSNAPDFHWVSRLGIASDGTYLLAATRTGIFRSHDLGLTWNKSSSVSNMVEIRTHPTNPDMAVAGSQSGDAYYSVDAGLTWTKAVHPSPWSGRVELSYASANPDVVYASVQMDSGEIWRSSDGGQSYQKRNSLDHNGAVANYLGGQGWYDNCIWAGDPHDADLILAGGVDMWKSTDGGNTMKKITLWSDSDSMHADHHAIVSHPDFGTDGNRTVFFGNDGGVYKTTDIDTAGDPDPTVGWQSLVKGYEVTQFYGGAGNSTSGIIVGGAQDNGSLSFDPANGINQWAEFFGGDGGFVASDPTDPDIFYGEYVYMEIFRNNNGAADDSNWWENYITGRYWDPTISGWNWKPLPFTVPEVRTQKGLFIAPFVLDPNDSNRILGGALSVWRSNDVKTPNTNTSGPSWHSIKAGNAGGRVSAITIAEGNSDLIWIGYEHGQIHRTQNGTDNNPTWERIDQSGPGALTIQRYCTRIVIDSSDFDTSYVMYGGYKADNIWKTTDAGTTWIDISATLPDAPIRTLAIHPNRSDYLYVGTEVGLFSSEDAGISWSATNEGPTNCAVYDLFWMGTGLVCVTHGRGMFTIDLGAI